jgi:hypothetical protein
MLRPDSGENKTVPTADFKKASGAGKVLGKSPQNDLVSCTKPEVLRFELKKALVGIGGKSLVRFRKFRGKRQICSDPCWMLATPRTQPGNLLETLAAQETYLHFAHLNKRPKRKRIPEINFKALFPVQLRSLWNIYAVFLGVLHVDRASRQKGVRRDVDCVVQRCVDSDEAAGADVHATRNDDLKGEKTMIVDDVVADMNPTLQCDIASYWGKRLDHIVLHLLNGQHRTRRQLSSC